MVTTNILINVLNVLAILIGSQAISSCPNKCVCSKSPITIRCESSIQSPISIFPKFIPFGTERLILDGHNISTLPYRAMSAGGRSLKYLAIRNNTINEVEEFAFQSLPNLQHLHLKKNYISQLRKSVFADLHQLNDLDLNDNLISNIPCFLFNHMIKLNQIKLAKNQLKVINGCMFKGLSNIRVLDISNNQIRSISLDAFNGLEKLQDLRINNNLLSSVSSQWFLKKHLAFVQLSSNLWKCTCIMRREYSLALAYTGIEINCKSDNMCLACNSPLILQNQIINEVKDRVWEELCGNKINSTKFVRTYSSVVAQNTKSRQIRSIFENSGNDAQGMIQCHPGSSLLCVLVPGNVSFINKATIPREVYALLIANNQFHSINDSDFKGFFNLSLLIMHNNVIAHIEEFSFLDQSQLEEINLDDNRLQNISKNMFYGLTGLVRLFLRRNVINGALRKGTFQYLTNMKELILSYNQITELEACLFCNITTITTLDLSFNLISTIHKNSFQGLDNIIELRLNDNRIKTFDFSTLIPPNNLSLLATFMTENNNWSCTCALHRNYLAFISMSGFIVSCGNTNRMCVECSEPTNFKNIPLYLLREAHFTDCPVITEMTTNIEITTAPSESTTIMQTTIPITTEPTKSNTEIEMTTELLESTTVLLKNMSITTEPTTRKIKIIATTMELKPTIGTTSARATTINSLSKQRYQMMTYLLLAILIPVIGVVIIIIAVLIYVTINKSQEVITANGGAGGNNNDAFSNISMTDVTVFEENDTSNP